MLSLLLSIKEAPPISSFKPDYFFLTHQAPSTSWICFMQSWINNRSVFPWPSIFFLGGGGGEGTTQAFWPRNISNYPDDQRPLAFDLWPLAHVRRQSIPFMQPILNKISLPSLTLSTYTAPNTEKITKESFVFFSRHLFLTKLLTKIYPVAPSGGGGGARVHICPCLLRNQLWIKRTANDKQQTLLLLDLLLFGRE